MKQQRKMLAAVPGMVYSIIETKIIRPRMSTPLDQDPICYKYTAHMSKSKQSIFVPLANLYK
jgi:hypothetical protein